MRKWKDASAIVSGPSSFSLRVLPAPYIGFLYLVGICCQRHSASQDVKLIMSFLKGNHPVRLWYLFFRTRSNLSRLSHAQVYVDESGGRSETGDALMKDSAPWNTMKPLTFSTGMCSEVQWHQPVLSLSHHSLGRCQSCRWEADSSCNSEVKFSAPFPIRVHLKHPETSGAPGPKFNTLWLCQNSYWKWPLISWVFPLKMVIFHINHHFPMVFPWFSHEKWWIFP